MKNLHAVSFAALGDEDEIVAFIGAYWKPDHILARNREVFRQQYLQDGRLQFVIARSCADRAIHGILGFVLYSDGAACRDCFTALWRVVEGNGDPMLGLKLVNFLERELKARSVSGLGANPKTLPLWEFMGYRTGCMDQYYMLNQHVSDFRIALVPETRRSAVRGRSDVGCVLRELPGFSAFGKAFDAEEHRETLPFKDASYIRKRYYEYPFYSYSLYGVEKDSAIRTVLVTRSIRVENAVCLRIVDLLGQPAGLSFAGGALRRLMEEKGYEYIDFLVSGVDDEIMSAAGFTLLDPRSDVVIPHYFEPFERKNRKVHFFTSYQGTIRLCKADGDQDRPNA
ncbi:MAG TPA: hypothetical protein P5110_07295 [Candidatus Omnitrophota bacterium]|nr:hypothetical protein [Candidatus Omnitrophota bacterium]HRZ15294.1 hypothetical protein [Candidatus Omnitrophota bacterium]